MGHRENCFPEVKKFFEVPVAGWSILEIGPGTDTFYRSFFEKEGMTYTSIDPLDVKNGSNCYIGKMEQLPFRNERFDIVFACHAFEHCEKPVDALREFMRVLRPGGYLFILTPPHCKWHVLEADADHINVLTEWQMKRLLIYAGFRQMSVHTSKIAPKKQDHNLVSIARKNGGT